MDKKHIHFDIEDTQKDLQSAFRDLDEKFRFLFENMVQGVFYQRADGVLIDVNPAALKMFGLTKDEFLGRTSVDPRWKIITEDGSPFPGEQHPSMRALRTGQPVRNVVAGIYNPKIEDRTWIAINAIPQFRPGEDHPYQVFVTIHDITDQKKAKDALERRKQELENTLSATTDGIWSWNFETGKLNFSNKYYEMLGYTPGEFDATYENWTNLIHPEDREKALKSAEDYLKTKADIYENEFRLRMKTGEYRWIHTKGKVVKRDPDGKALYMIGNHEDITKRKTAEEELVQIFSMSLDMLCIADIHTATFLKVNPAFLETLGFTEDELLEKPFLDFIHPDDVDSTRSVIEKKLLAGAKVINFENRYRCKDGGYRWLSWVSHPDPEKRVTYAVARDITDWKIAEQMLEESKSLLDVTGRLARVGGWELDADTLEVNWTEETYRIHEVPFDYKPPLEEAIKFFSSRRPGTSISGHSIGAEGG